MGLWSWLRERSRPEAGAGLRADGARADRATPRPPPDPGWRALPPVQRTLADGVHSVARLGDFAGSLVDLADPARCSPSWSTGGARRRPRDRPWGSSTRCPARPGVAQLPVAGVPLSR